MECPRCRGLVIEVHEVLETYPTVILRCLACGMRVYEAYRDRPERICALKGRHE